MSVVKVEKCHQACPVSVQVPSVLVPSGFVRPLPLHPIDIAAMAAFASLASLAALASSAPPLCQTQPLSSGEMSLVVEEKKKEKNNKLLKPKTRKPPVNTTTTRGTSVFVDGRYVASAAIQIQSDKITVFFLGECVTTGLDATWGEVILKLRDLYNSRNSMELSKNKLSVRVLPKFLRNAKVLAKNKKVTSQPGTLAKEDTRIATIFTSAKSVIANNRERDSKGRLVKVEKVQVKHEQ